MPPKLEVGDIVDVRTSVGGRKWSRGVVACIRRGYPHVRFFDPSPALKNHCDNNLRHQDALWGVGSGDRARVVPRPKDEDIAAATRILLTEGVY